MRLWKRSILLFVGLAILSMSTITVSAVTITDDIDDVWYRWYEYDPTTGTEELPLVANKPNIDITSVSYTITGSELTLTMTVDGTFEDSALIGYMIYFGNGTFMSPSSRYYVASYSNGSGEYGALDMEEYAYGNLTNPISGNTFTATFEMIADLDPTFELWGLAAEHKEVYEEGDTFEWDWMDYAPNSYSPWYGNDEDDETTGDSESTYYIDLGEYWPELRGYDFSFSVPEGYSAENLGLNKSRGLNIVVQLSGPPILEDGLEADPADITYVMIKKLIECTGDFDFNVIPRFSCGGPLPSYETLSNRTTNGYDDYYQKIIDCLYCVGDDFEDWFFESTIAGVIFLEESLKCPALAYIVGYDDAWLCESNDDLVVLTIDGTTLDEKRREVVENIFSSIQLTFSPPENESYIPPDKKEEMPVTEIVIVTSAAAGGAVLLGFLATEWGKYKFLSFLPLLGPLYLRTVKEDVFDNQKRLCMYNHIAENQPVVYTEIKKTCNLSDGEINWHAHMMVQLDLIKTERKGFHLFFYLAESPRLSPAEFIRLTDVQKSIFDLIVKKPGVTQVEIVEKFGLKQQNISYNLLKLEEKGKIRVEKKGTVKLYYPIKRDSSSV